MPEQKENKSQMKISFGFFIFGHLTIIGIEIQIASV
jgi:hypothetical protein